VAGLSGRLSAPTLAALRKLRYTELMPIQAAALTPLMEGRDVVGTAQTGSGKTAAFLIPAFELLHREGFAPADGTGVLVVCPTRELSMQTYAVMEVFAKKHKVSYGIVTGGAGKEAEKEGLAKGMNILVATPGRILDHLKNTRFQLNNLKCLVLDEADRMLGLGFEEEMKRLLEYLPTERQTVMFSATRNSKTDSLTKLALKANPVEIDVDKDKQAATVDKLDQYYLVCEPEDRLSMLFSFLTHKKGEKIMVFFSSCDAVKFYSELLSICSIKVLTIHGKKKQDKRSETFFKFRDAESGGVLLCTDVAARGWDVPDVDWILQYDPPEDPKEYIHRVGRTARAGRSGKALILLSAEELPFVDFLRESRVTVNRAAAPPEALCGVQRQIEELVQREMNLLLSAKEAFKSCLATYNKHQMKNIFDKNKLDKDKLARSFGLSKAPEAKVVDGLKLSRNSSYNRPRHNPYQRHK